MATPRGWGSVCGGGTLKDLGECLGSWGVTAAKGGCIRKVADGKQLDVWLGQPHKLDERENNTHRHRLSGVYGDRAMGWGSHPWKLSTMVQTTSGFAFEKGGIAMSVDGSDIDRIELEGLDKT
ncbi:unnamed protein product [Ectocarpus sp. 8 AP-2014]